MKGLLRQVGVQMLGAGFCAGVSFFLMMWLGRVLGAAEFGRYVLLLNLATLGLVLIEGGWPTLVYRQEARQGTHGAEAGGLVRTALFHVLSVSCVLVVLAVLLPVDEALVVAFLCMACVAVMNLVSARMRAVGRFALEAGWQSVGRVVSAGVILLVVWLNRAAPLWIFAAWGGGLLLVLLAWGRSWLLLPRVAGWVEGWREVWPFLLMGGLAAWLLKGDVVLLGGAGDHFLAPGELSWYAAGTRLSEAALLLAAPLGNVLLGRFSRMAVCGDRGLGVLRAQAERLIVLVFVGGWLAVAVACGAGEGLMLLLFGAEFEAAGRLLPWVLLMLPFALGNIVLFALLTSLGCERGLVGCMALGGGGLLVLVPALGAGAGAQGGALGMAVAHALVFVLGGRLAWRVLSDRLGVD